MINSDKWDDITLVGSKTDMLQKAAIDARNARKQAHKAELELLQQIPVHKSHWKSEWTVWLFAIVSVSMAIGLRVMHGA